VPIINEPECAVIDICMALVDSASRLVSTNLALLQLTNPQAVRLLERFGGLTELLEALDTLRLDISTPSTRRSLTREGTETVTASVATAK
jgi:hypothetical protein